MKFLRKIPLLLVLLTACTPVSTTPVFSVTSDAFVQNGRIPQIYTCDGENARPPLTISGVPNGTVSFAIIMEDPDAPSGLFTHWTAWNIDPKVTIIATDNPLEGAREGVNSANAFGYFGPCPQSGAHRYVIRVFAVNRTLTLPTTATPEELKKDLADYVLAQTEITGLYEKTSAPANTGTGSKTLPGSTVVE